MGSPSSRASASWPRASSAGRWRAARRAIEDFAVVLDLTIGGTILATGALVGRARAAEARREAQLGVLQHAARRMSASLSREEVGRAVVEETRRVIDYHNARVYLLDPPDDLVPIAFEGRVGAYEKVDLAILRTKIGEGFTGWVALHGRPLRVDDATSDPRGETIPGTDDVDESMLVVPMQHDGKLIGVITLSKLGLRQFDDEDLRLLTILADQAATAFSGAANLAETRRLAAELRQLLDMNSALSRIARPARGRRPDGRARRPRRRRRPRPDQRLGPSQRPPADARLLPDRRPRGHGRLLPARGLPAHVPGPRERRHRDASTPRTRPRIRPRPSCSGATACAAS